MTWEPPPLLHPLLPQPSCAKTRQTQQMQIHTVRFAGRMNQRPAATAAAAAAATTTTIRTCNHPSPTCVSPPKSNPKREAERARGTHSASLHTRTIESEVRLSSSAKRPCLADALQDVEEAEPDDIYSDAYNS